MNLRKSLLVLFALIGASVVTTPAAAKRIALVVGINAYDNLNAEQQLLKAVNDARSIASTLKDVGFQVILVQDARRNDFLRAWQRFLDSIQPGDTAALYFAGHGFEINGANYLLTRDVPAANDGEEVLKSSGIRIGALMERLKEQQPQVTVFILDACRNSPYASAGIKRSLGSTRGLQREEPPKGTLVMMSAGAGQEALDSLSAADAHPNSVYTRTLLPLLKEPGLEITDLAKRVRSEVETLAATIRHEQRPAFYHELSGNFFLAPGSSSPVAAAGGAAGLSEAAQAWSVTKDSNSIAVLEAFNQQFASTVYGGMARARINELRRVQTAAIVPSAPATVKPAPAPKSELLPPPQARPSAFEAAQAWSRTRDTTNPAMLERFLRDFGDSIYVGQAKARLDDLKRTQIAAAPAGVDASPTSAPVARTAPSAFDAAQAWAKVRTTENVRDIEAFLQNYEGTIYADMARQRLKQITTLAFSAPVARPQAPSAALPAVGIFSKSRANAPLTTAEQAAIKPKDSFQECGNCPEMIVVPAGRFKMGSPGSETGRAPNEGPQREIVFAKNFAAGKFAVTFQEWDACVEGGGCNGYRPPDEGGQRGRHPAVNVSWTDAKSYVAWLSKTTGKPYRLLSEAEREYVTRAGTTTPFWWGTTISTNQANYDGRATSAAGPKGEFRQHTLPVDAFEPNPWGFHQVHGNVDEWVEDCWFGNFDTASPDGSARSGDCGRRVLRGGSWYEAPAMLRAASRTGFYPGFRSNKIGFRVARPL